MAAKMLDRRALIRQLALGGGAAALALEQLGGVPLFGTWASEYLANPLNRYDAFVNMRDALRGGQSILGVHKAMAAAEDDWTLVQIKVCNHVHTPLVFKLGELAAGVVTVSSGVPLPTDQMGVAKTTLTSAGVNLISDRPRYQSLRFNKWFADMLHEGTADGRAPVTGNLVGLDSADVGPLDADKVAIQTFLGLKQIEANNHALKGCKVRSTLPDITLFAQEKGLITSPLGISCFMMGGNYDKAEGATPINAVLGAGGGESVVVTSRSVSAYVAQIQQYVGKSYADRASIEQNVIYRMDQLVEEDPVLRRDLVRSISQFKEGLVSLTGCADLESLRQSYVAAMANAQSEGGANSLVQRGASSEFLAQCRYVANSVDLPGMPVRNFSLFLNVSDLDGNKLDVAFGGGGGGGVRAYSYVEGMRQLAMGLNVLGKKIAAGKKIMVVVHSEGGRAANMGDAVNSFAIVIGPRGAGMLDDALYATMAEINKPGSTQVINMAAAGAEKPWEEGLYSDGGIAVTNRPPSSGDVQMGVVEFLESKTGAKARQGLPSGDGAFVKLKRFA